MISFLLAMAQAAASDAALLARQDRTMAYTNLEATILWDQRPTLNDIAIISRKYELQDRDVSVQCAVLKDGHISDCKFYGDQKTSDHLRVAVHQLEDKYRLDLDQGRKWFLAKVVFLIPFRSALIPRPDPL